MQRFPVILPDDVHSKIKRLAKAEGIPVKQYVACALTRHIELVDAGVPEVNKVLPVVPAASSAPEASAAPTETTVASTVTTLPANQAPEPMPEPMAEAAPEQGLEEMAEAMTEAMKEAIAS